jgi:hypothetical protein
VENSIFSNNVALRKYGKNNRYLYFASNRGYNNGREYLYFSTKILPPLRRQENVSRLILSFVLLTVLRAFPQYELWQRKLPSLLRMSDGALSAAITIIYTYFLPEITHINKSLRFSFSFGPLCCNVAAIKGTNCGGINFLNVMFNVLKSCKVNFQHNFSLFVGSMVKSGPCLPKHMTYIFLGHIPDGKCLPKKIKGHDRQRQMNKFSVLDY